MIALRAPALLPCARSSAAPQAHRPLAARLPVQPLALLGAAAARLPTASVPRTFKGVVAKSSGERRRFGAGRKVTTMGVPVVGFFLQPWFLILTWAAGMVRLYGGWNRTTYSDAPAAKAALIALWPVLVILSGQFRKNFKKAAL